MGGNHGRRLWKEIIEGKYEETACNIFSSCNAVQPLTIGGQSGCSCSGIAASNSNTAGTSGNGTVCYDSKRFGKPCAPCGIDDQLQGARRVDTDPRDTRQQGSRGKQAMANAPERGWTCRNTRGAGAAREHSTLDGTEDNLGNFHFFIYVVCTNIFNKRT